MRVSRRRGPSRAGNRRILLSLVVYGSSGWLAVGIIFSLLAAWAPEYLLDWVLIVFLASVSSAVRRL